MSSWNATRLLPLALAAAAACESTTDPAKARNVKQASAYRFPAEPCPTGAVKIEVSVYPKTIPVGGTATPYVSLFNSSKAELRVYSVVWTLSDTNVARIAAWDEHGRPVLLGKSGGTTQVIGTCGTTSLSTSMPLTVTGGSTTTTDTAKTGSVTAVVTLASPTIAPGQTTQASVSATDASGNQITIPSGLTWTSSNTGVATVSSSGLGLGGLRRCRSIT